MNKAALVGVLLFVPAQQFLPPASAAAATVSAALDSLIWSAPEGFTLPVPPAPRAALPASLSGEELFQALHKLTPKRDVSYGAAKQYMYATADNVACGGGTGIIAFYSAVCVPGSGPDGRNYPERTDLDGDGVVDAFINAEHIWPQSYFKSALPMVSDLFNLEPTLSTPNSRRGNVRYAMVGKADYSTSCGTKRGKEGFEPCDQFKGNVARHVLYFVLAYHDRDIRQGMDYNEFWVKQVPMFLEWNRQDPPDEAERRRNGLAEKLQGNRNPFVDDPSLADRIGAPVFASH